MGATAARACRSSSGQPTAPGPGTPNHAARTARWAGGTSPRARARLRSRATSDAPSTAASIAAAAAIPSAASAVAPGALRARTTASRSGTATRRSGLISRRCQGMRVAAIHVRRRRVKFRYMLDVTRLRVLREVVRAGSISGAARALSYTPSAVSQQLAKLERETGTRLLVRSSRGVRPTEAGAALAARADEILARLADAEAELGAIAGRPRPLRIGSFPTAGASVLPPALRSLSRTHPDVEVRVEQLDPLEAMARVATHDLDLALLYEYDHVPLPSDPRLELTPLFAEPLRVVLPADHPRRPRDPGRARRARRRDLALVLPALVVPPVHRARLRRRRLPAEDRPRLRRLHRDAGTRRGGDRGRVRARLRARAAAPRSGRPAGGVPGPSRRISAAVASDAEPDPGRDAFLRALVAAASAGDAAYATAT